MWTFVLELAIFVASIFIQKALTPKISGPQPSGVGSLEAPTADATRPIPVVFGTCKVAAPNVLWFGHTSVTPYYRGVYQAGYHYHAVMDLGVCHGPVDAIKELLIDDINVHWTNDADDPTHGLSYYTVNAPDLFGGDGGGGGGFTAAVEAYWGTTTQQISPVMQLYCSPDYPGLSGLCHLVMSAMVGNSTYLRPIAVVVERCPNGLGVTAGHHQIVSTVGALTSNDANPACMLYELLTDTTWGLGMDPASIDVTNFRAVGETLYTEGFGLSMVFDSASPAADLIREILRHIDGGLTTDPGTGKLVLRLIRDDYTVGSLLVLDQSCVSEVEYSRSSWSETANTARVSYISWVDNFTERITQWQNLANQQVVGVATIVQAAYRGCSNSRVAGIVTSRVLKLSSYPFAHLRLKANRKAWQLRQCDVFVLNWPALGISGMVCRVTKPAGGTLEDGMMSIECVEDAFAIANTAFSDPGGAGWDGSGPGPVPLVYQRVIEAGEQLSRAGDYTAFWNRDPWLLAARPIAELAGLQVWTDPAGGTDYVRSGEAHSFTPYGLMQASIAINTAYVYAPGFVVDNLVEAEKLDAATPIVFTNVTFKGLMLIDEEIMGYTGISGTGSSRTVTGVWRGLFDTVPAAHAADAPVWFVLNNNERCQVNDTYPGYATNASLKLVGLTMTARSLEPIADATPLTITLAARGSKPYPPGDVKVGGNSWPGTIAHGSTITVSWARRDNTTLLTGPTAAGQGDASYTDASLNPIFEVKLWIDGVLERTTGGITGTSFNWTSAMQALDCGVSYGKTILVRITPYKWDGTNPGTYQERTFIIT